MFDFLPVLTSLFVVPIFSAFVILLIDNKNTNVDKNSRFVAIFSSSVSLVLSGLCVLWYAQNNHGGFALLESYPLGVLPGFHIILGVDSLALTFIVLTNFLFLMIHILGEAQSVRYREYVVLMLITQGLLIAFFAARDLLMFYILFEAILVPLFFIIGIWGGPNRMYATFKFFLITFMGSLGFLFSLLVLYQTHNTFDLSVLKALMVQQPPTSLVWWAIFVTFAIKIPMFFVHTWLPNAHVEAPTTASMILAGILLKLGGYGMIRCILDLMPYLTFAFSDVVRVVSIVAILYAGLIAFVQTDMKRMVAYASIGHMGFVTLGLFNLNSHGLNGAVFQMFSHGLISAAMFMVVGLLYKRLHTRELTEFSGLTQRFPILVGCMGVYIFGLIGFPGTCGFLGEFLVYLSTSQVNFYYLSWIALGTVITAAYGLSFFKTVAFGKEKLSAHYEEIKCTWNEYVCLIAFAVPIILFGVFPQGLVQFYQESLKKISVEYRMIPDTSKDAGESE